jgi:hypothetical protein
MTNARNLRPKLPADAGINSRVLDLELTREELALSLDELFAKFNLRLIITSRPAIFAGIFLIGTVASSIAVVSSVRRRDRRG